MEYPGPSDDELRNVRALNRSFLDCLRSTPSRAELRDQLGVPLNELVAALSRRQLACLSATPFLLFSLREQENEFWDELFSDGGSEDFFSPRPHPEGATAQLLAAGLGFLWQLARRNAYAARLVSGATLYWCEQLSECTLVSLLSRTVHRGDLLVPRFADSADVWKKLLGAGVSSEAPVRRAAQLTAMQTMLTRTGQPHTERLRAAACRLPPPRTR